MTFAVKDWALVHIAAFGPEKAWPEKDFETLAATPGTICIGDDKAFVLVRIVADEAEVLTLATHPAHRRQRLALQRLAEAESAVRKRAKTIFLEVDANNIPARELYAKTGYEQVGQRAGYYRHSDGSRTDALILRKNLT